MDPFNMSIDHQMSILHHFCSNFPKKKNNIYPFGQILLLLCFCAVVSFRSWVQKFEFFSTPILKGCSAQSPNTVTESFLTLIGVYLLTAVGKTVRTENKRMMSRNGLTDWGRKQKSNRARQRKMDYKRMSRRPREARKLFTSTHPCRAHMSMFPSPRWCTQGSNDECILSQSPLLTLRVHQQFCCWQTRQNPFIIHCFCCFENEWN